MPSECDKAVWDGADFCLWSCGVLFHEQLLSMYFFTSTSGRCTIVRLRVVDRPCPTAVSSRRSVPEKRRTCHSVPDLPASPLCTGLCLSLSIWRRVLAICPQSTALRQLVLYLSNSSWSKERLSPNGGYTGKQNRLPQPVDFLLWSNFAISPFAT